MPFVPRTGTPAKVPESGAASCPPSEAAGCLITLGLREQGGKTLLSVQDTGIGIPGKLHGNLFDKFNPTRRAGLQGETTTGLGLFIAKQIVELHGGAIWLESREQEGTTFFIELA